MTKLKSIFEQIIIVGASNNLTKILIQVFTNTVVIERNNCHNAENFIKIVDITNDVGLMQAKTSL